MTIFFLRLAALCFLLFSSIGEVFAEGLPNRDLEIRMAIEQYLQQKTGGLDFEAKIKRLTIQNSALPQDGSLDYEIIAPQQWEGWGNVNLAVVARRGDRIIRNIPVRVEVEALADMVVASRQIDHGTVITRDDLAIRRQDVASVRGHYLKRADDAVGKKTRQTVRTNTPLKPDQLVKVALIHSGQTVTIIAEQGSMRITMTGKAKGSGGLGDVINVQNSSSLKEFPAKVIDANTVQAIF